MCARVYGSGADVVRRGATLLGCTRSGSRLFQATDFESNFLQISKLNYTKV
jgi:hypothetical protein